MPCQAPSWDDYGQTFEALRQYDGPVETWYYMVDGRQQRIKLRECQPTDTTQGIRREIEAHLKAPRTPAPQR